MLLPLLVMADVIAMWQSTGWIYFNFSTADLEEAKLDTGESLSKFKIISVIREHLALSRKK